MAEFDVISAENRNNVLHQMLRGPAHAVPVENTRVLLADAEKAEARFAARRYQGDLETVTPSVIQGDTPVIVSCPHAVMHTRNGRGKYAEVFTGALATLVGRATGAPVVVHARSDGSDPNYDRSCQYKDTLAKLVRTANPVAMIDIHGIGLNRDAPVVIGTGLGKTVERAPEARSIVVAALTHHGIEPIVVDRPGYFDAARTTTLAMYASQELDVPCVQIELRRDLRNPRNQPECFEAAYRGLSRAVLQLATLRS